MPYKLEEGKIAIIDAILNKIKSTIKDEQGKLCETFARQMLINVAYDDLKEKTIEDLYGALISFWNFIYQRNPGETKIRIYNPAYERHGWQTTHTVIEVLHDDMPFLVDSILMEVHRMGLTAHLVIHMGGIKVRRNDKHQIIDILPHSDDSDNAVVEAPILLEINRQTDQRMLDELHRNLERVLNDARAIVQDWNKMRERVRESIKELDEIAQFVDPNELSESQAFLTWLEDHHFTFLGIRDYELVDVNGDKVLRVIPNTGLGVLHESTNSRVSRTLMSMPLEARKLMLSSQILIISKTNTISNIHRPIYSDYIGIKRFDSNGKVIGERRVVGLFTATAYNTATKNIPILRLKVGKVMENSELKPRSHAGKVLLNILETLPRDDLFQASEDELLEIAMGIYHLQERRKIKMFARKDIYGRFVSCLVFVPRDRFDTKLRIDIEKILEEAFNAQEISYTTRFSDSILARIHFIVRTNPDDQIEYDFKEVENKIIEIGRSWTDEFQSILLEVCGEEQGNILIQNYGNAFPGSYREAFTPRTGVYDVKHIEKLAARRKLELNFYQPLDDSTGALRFKIYNYDDTTPLSDVLPILENMGLRVISERPYMVQVASGRKIWINDFGMVYNGTNELNIDDVKETFQTAFERVWFNYADNDKFNQLVLGAGLNWREVTILRAYAKYFKQIGVTFSQAYIEATLVANPEIVKQLIRLFHTRQDPRDNPSRLREAEEIRDKLLKDLDDVVSLDHDIILRLYIEAIQATLRTNYFQAKDGNFKNYLSLKISPQEIAGVPLPHPMYEIFVYSPRFEATHLRCAKVARGGIRWSDRHDFRTEVLGLMKAQQVKNAVIVPSGAKGGFVPKNLPLQGSREEILAEGIECYKSFISGLLDITDNYQGDSIVKPENVYCHDDDDPYLVVAADKGTATFSDIANELSQQYNFWLGDAFASGGSAGYDHKKIGITARGAWESVKRHFRELGVDIQNTDFTVIGIGDMAGDVFGNGMLLSKHTKLVGAFNHLHIFLDPDPDPEISFNERERLFHLPRSNWTDYNAELLSSGGGIFNRSAKSIKLTPEIKQLLQLQQDYIVPNDLIRAMFKAPVDLLWNGGIGTFVKASDENTLDVGDRTNDNIRISANELRCKVVGEGGNLGFTQLARIEYAINGGLIYTDFIDNSGGVDCSDNEVNIKILLNAVVANGDITEKQRNQLLVEMTNEVAELVLQDNYQQTQAISLAATQALRNIELHIRYIRELEHIGRLVRALEFLPEEKIILERKLLGKGLTRPSIAVLLAYSKTMLSDQILASDVPEDPYLGKTLINAFPQPLRVKYSKEMTHHRLRREIIATKLSNSIVNEMGFTFIYRMQDETGATVSSIVRAYTVARSVFELEKTWQAIQALDNKIPAQAQIDMMMQFIRLIRRSTRWFLRNQRFHLDIATAVAKYSPGIAEIKQAVLTILEGPDIQSYKQSLKSYTSMGIPEELAHNLSSIRILFSALDILEIARELEQKITEVAKIYFYIGSYLDLGWIRTQIIMNPTEDHWEALSREALRDDLDWQQRQLTLGIIRNDPDQTDAKQCLENWTQRYAVLIERARNLVAELRANQTLNFTMFFVAIRELQDLTQTTLQNIPVNRKLNSEKKRGKAA